MFRWPERISPLIVKAETFRSSRNKETCPLMRTSAPSTALDKELRPSVCRWEESPWLAGGHRDELLSLLTQSSGPLVSPLAALLQVRRFFLR